MRYAVGHMPRGPDRLIGRLTDGRVAVYSRGAKAVDGVPGDGPTDPGKLWLAVRCPGTGSWRRRPETQRVLVLRRPRNDGSTPDPDVLRPHTGTSSVPQRIRLVECPTQWRANARPCGLRDGRTVFRESTVRCGRGDTRFWRGSLFNASMMGPVPVFRESATETRVVTIQGSSSAFG